MEGETTQSLRRNTVNRVEKTKQHPRETFDEAVARLVDERAALLLIERKDPHLVLQARLEVAGA
jgi:hypothetical protein